MLNDKQLRPLLFRLTACSLRTCSRRELKSPRPPVAILGSNSVDVRDIDETSLVFGPDRAPALPRVAQGLGRGPHPFDANHDGFPDLLIRFEGHATGLRASDGDACLVDKIDGQIFWACGPVDIRVKPNRNRVGSVMGTDPPWPTLSGRRGGGVRPDTVTLAGRGRGSALGPRTTRRRVPLPKRAMCGGAMPSLVGSS